MIAYIYRNFETDTVRSLAQESMEMWRAATEAVGVPFCAVELEEAYQSPPQGSDVYYFRSIGSHGLKAQSIIRRGRPRKVIDPYLRVRHRAHTKAEMLDVFIANNIPNTGDEILTAVQLEERWDQIRSQRMVIRASKGGRRGTRTWRLWPSSKAKYLFESWLENEAGQIEGFDPHETKFLLSSFVPNDGDWRLITVGSRCVGAYKRNRKRRQFHLTASKGKSQWAAPPQSVAEVAVAAATALGYMIASHDIIINQLTGEPIVIETNSAPSFGVFYRRTGVNPFEILIEEVMNNV